MAKNNASIGPTLRGSQFSGGGSGDGPDQTINLFRGDVNLPLTLLKLPGLNGLEVNVSAYYSAALGLAPTTWSLEAPTSVLGLGWGLGFDQISFAGGGTASYLEGTYVAQINGRETALIPLTWTNRATATEQLTFAARDANPLWQFTYWPAQEKWTVLRDDGVCLTFGDAADTQSNGVQWGVRWDNWTGDSCATAGSPQRFGRAWNCIRAQDHWGNAIRYAYTVETAPVAAGLTHTRACYLSQVTDAFGRTAVFTYADKRSDEYQPPNTRAGKAPAGGYQDCYETKYLAGIAVTAPGGAPYGRIELDYSLHTPSANGTGFTKRLLTGVRRLRGNRLLEAPTCYTYDQDPGSPSYGRVLSATDPKGAVMRWDYARHALGASPVFDLSYTAQRPAGWDAALAIPFFGDDYVMIAWYSQTNAMLKVQVLQYGGRWAQQPYEIDLHQVNPGTASNVRIAFGGDFFVLFIQNQASTNGRLVAFQKTANQFGRWTCLDWGSIPYQSTLGAETALVAGDDFFALHAGGEQTVYRFTCNRHGLNWSPAPGTNLTGSSPPGALVGPNQETHVALAAAGNRLAVGWFQGTTTVQARDQVYWLDPTAAGGPAWQALVPASALQTALGSFTWDGGYAANYFTFGSGWVVSTAPGTTGKARLHCLRWSRNFTSYKSDSLTGDALLTNGFAQPTLAGDHLIANGGQLYRFDGAQWQSQSYTTWTGRQLAAGGDWVIASGSTGTQAVRFDPVTGHWLTTTLTPPNALTSTAPAAQVVGDFMTLGTNLYYNDTDGTWHPLAGALAGGNAGSMACRGGNFTAYETAGTSAIETHVVLPANGQTGAPLVLSGQRIANLGGGAGGMLAGASAFATFSNSYTDFTRVPSFTLHRVLNRQLDGYLSDVIVTRLTHDTGLQRLTQVFSYDPGTAIFDPTGTVAQYPAVTVEHQDEQGNGLGKTIYRYLNGLAPASTSDPIDSCYSLAGGQVQAQEEYDATGQLVATRTHRWQGVTLTTAAAGGFTPLAGVVSFVPLAQDATLDNLPLVDVGTNQPTGATGSRRATLNYSYIPATGQVRDRSAALWDADGVARTRTERFTYAWEQYAQIGRPTDGSAPRFAPQARVTLFNEGIAVKAQVTHYSNAWDGQAVWEAAGQWLWRGKTPAAGDPAFDFTDLTANAAEWVNHYRIGARTAGGQPCLAHDALGNAGRRTYDAAGLRPIATFKGSDGSDACFTGCEDYEAPNPWQGGTLTTTDAHTGSRCMVLAAGEAMTCNRLLSASSEDRYRLSVFVKSVAGTGVGLSLAVGGAAPATLEAEATDAWQYLTLVADAGAAGQPLAAAITNTGTAALLVDDLRIAPLVCEFQAQVYDPLWLPAATLAANGSTTRTFRDAVLRPLATTGADDQVARYRAQGWVPGGVDAAAGRFNQELGLEAADAGPFDLFGGDWAQRWTPSGSTAAWQVQGDALIHTGSTRDALVRNDCNPAANLAAAVQVLAADGSAAPGGDFGITLGGLGVQWSTAAQSWQLVDGSGSVLAQGADPNGGAPLLPCDLAVVFRPRAVAFFVDHLLVLSHAFADAADPLSGALSLWSAADGLGFRQFLSLHTPLGGLLFGDGAARPVQAQALGDNAIICMQRFYDGRGRQHVQTKPAPYAETPLGWRADFATAPDPNADWVMTGRVADFYNGTGDQPDDQGYPYRRTRYEDSALNRVLEQGQPGRELAIRAGNPYTNRQLHGTNAAGPFFADTAAAALFGVVLHTDPDGMTQSQTTDGLRNPIAVTAAGLATGDLAG